MEVKETGRERECLMSFLERRDESGCRNQFFSDDRFLFFYFLFLVGDPAVALTVKLFSVERVKCNIDDPHVSPFYS